MLKSATAYIFALCLVCLVGVIVLLVTNTNVPTELWAALTLLLGGGLGISSPVPAVSSTSVPAPAGVPRAADTAPVLPPPVG